MQIRQDKAVKAADGQSATAKTNLAVLPVKPENIFHFPGGLPAFENVKEFVFLSRPDTSPFFIMQSLEPRDLSFVCINPFMVCPEYAPVISKADTRSLELQSPEDVFLFCLVTVTPDVTRITANLHAPVVINIRTGIGRQILCEGQSYPVRYRLWDAAGRMEQSQRNETQKRSIVWPSMEGVTNKTAAETIA